MGLRFPADGFEADVEPGVQGFGNATEHGQRVTFIGRGFQAADMLLAGLQAPGQR